MSSSSTTSFSVLIDAFLGFWRPISGLLQPSPASWRPPLFAVNTTDMVCSRKINYIEPNLGMFMPKAKNTSENSIDVSNIFLMQTSRAGRRSHHFQVSSRFATAQPARTAATNLQHAFHWGLASPSSLLPELAISNQSLNGRPHSRTPGRKQSEARKREYAFRKQTIICRSGF